MVLGSFSSVFSSVFVTTSGCSSCFGALLVVLVVLAGEVDLDSSASLTSFVCFFLFGVRDILLFACVL